MLVSAKELKDLPVFSADRERYFYVDSILDSTGLFIKAIVLRYHGMKATTEYVVPSSFVKVIYPGDGIYLNKDAEELELHQVASELPHIEALRFFGFEVSENHTPLVVTRNTYLTETGMECNYMENITRFKAQCVDEKLGRTRDLLVHPTTLNVHYFVVEVGHSFSKKWAYVPSQYLGSVDWRERVSLLNVTKGTITAGPLMKPNTDTNEALEIALDKSTPQTVWSTKGAETQMGSDDWRHMDF